MKIEDGSPDRMAFYNISQDDILGNTSPRLVPIRPSSKKIVQIENIESSCEELT